MFSIPGILAVLMRPKVLIAIGIAIALFFVAKWFVDVGYDRAIKAVDKQNEEAVNDADIAEYNLDQCIAARADGEPVFYDFGAGKCRRR